MTRTHPTGAFYLLPARMWELAIGGSARGRRHGMVAGVAHGAGRRRLDRRRRRGDRRADLRRVDRVPWIGRAPARARHRVDRRRRWAAMPRRLHRLRSSVTGRCSGSVAARTRSTCGTGRRWCSPRRSGARCRSPNGSSRSAIALALAAASLRLVEDPVRHSRWVASRPSRGLTLGASLCATVLVIGAISLALPRQLDGGTAAAAPVLAVVAPTTTVRTAAARSAPTPSAVCICRGPDRHRPREPRRGESGRARRRD